MNKIKRILFCGSLLLQTCLIKAQVITYNGPATIKASDKYSVSVEQNNNTYQSFVYKTTSPGTDNAPPGHTTSFTTFSFSGPIKIVVKRLDGKNVTKCTIRPKKYGIVPTVDGSSISFTIDRPRKLSVEFDEDLRFIQVDGKSLPIVQHSMLVFADSLETEIPDSNDANVIYFKPGVHKIGKNYRIPNGKTCYVAGGAYLIGNILNQDSYNIKLIGRGIISGESYTVIREFHLIDFGKSTTHDIKVEGITLIESPNYNLTIGGFNNTIRNVKMMSWFGQTDGIDATKNSLVEDCFLKVGDDAIKLYSSNSIVRRNTIWIQRTGAPFQFTWNMGGDISGVHVYDCDVIHTDWEVEHLNRGLFNSIGGGDGHLHDWLLENIRVEGHLWRVVYLQMKKTVYSPQPDYGEIDNIKMKNVSIEGPVLYKSIIKGVTDTYGPSKVHYYHDITIDSVTVNGNCMAQNDFTIDGATTKDIRITCGGTTTSVNDYLNAVPTRYELNQNYPNPFNPDTNISYSIPVSGFVSLKVYDLLGKEIRTIVNNFQNKGNYVVSFNAENLTSGIYFYKLQSGNFMLNRKMILLK